MISTSGLISEWLEDDYLVVAWALHEVGDTRWLEFTVNEPGAGIYGTKLEPLAEGVARETKDGGFWVEYRTLGMIEGGWHRMAKALDRVVALARTELG